MGNHEIKLQEIYIKNGKSTTSEALFPYHYFVPFNLFSDNSFLNLTMGG